MKRPLLPPGSSKLHKGHVCAEEIALMQPMTPKIYWYDIFRIIQCLNLGDSFKPGPQTSQNICVPQYLFNKNSCLSTRASLCFLQLGTLSDAADICRIVQPYLLGISQQNQFAHHRGSPCSSPPHILFTAEHQVNHCILFPQIQEAVLVSHVTQAGPNSLTGDFVSYLQLRRKICTPENTSNLACEM